MNDDGDGDGDGDAHTLGPDVEHVKARMTHHTTVAHKTVTAKDCTSKR